MSFFNLQNFDSPVNLTEKLALYMANSLSNKLGTPVPLPTYDLSYDILKDCEMIVAQVYRAYTNPIYLPWSIEEYLLSLSSHQNISTDENEERIRKRFPPLFLNVNGSLLPVQDQPCTVVDSTGVVVLWYLPDVVTQTRNDLMVANMHKLNHRFKQSLPAEGRPKKRRETGYKVQGTTTSPGHIPFSPCWFNIASQLTVSSSLRGWPNSSTVQYLHDDHESLSLLGALLALIHPQLAMRGLSILRGIQSGAISNVATNSLGPVRELWPCPFTAFSIISNRETDLHRDTKGFPPYYDITTTLGNYSNGRFEVPSIGLRFKYNPGTVIGLCGKALAHGVAEVDGERFCLVQYFHRKVLDLFYGYTVEAQRLHWMTQEELLGH